MNYKILGFVVCSLIAWTSLASIACSQDLKKSAFEAAKRATAFLTDHVSTEGGYLWRYSADLSAREGEGVVTSETIWVQPPGTPTVGEAFLKLWNATHDKQFLDAALAAGEALRLGQMESGGWQAMIEFEPERRTKWAYRTNAPQSRKAKDQSSLDDDKTQSALRFVIKLDQALQFEDAEIHAMATYGLKRLIASGQMESGGFPQVWTGEQQANSESDGELRASFPDSWPREYPGHREYWYRYTLNDGLAPDVLRTLFLAEEVYQEAAYRLAALKLADFLIASQLPEPQPAWAQQYSFSLQPIWARKFEPPAVTGGESQGVIETLMMVYRKTGDRKYLAPIPDALRYLRESTLPNGQLARFYELRTNRPLYFTMDYQLTYDDSDLPTHYGFKVNSRVDKLQKMFDQLDAEDADKFRLQSNERRRNEDETRVASVVKSLDQRGAWISNDGLRYHKRPGPVIDMRVATANLEILARYLDHAAEAN